LSETFLFLGKIQRDIRNVHRSSCNWEPRCSKRTDGQAGMTKLSRFLQFREKHLRAICIHNVWQSPTRWSRVLLEKLTGSQLVKKFPALYVTRRFMTAFTGAATCPYPEADQSSPYPHPTSRSILILSPSTPGSSKWSLSLRFPHQKPVCSSPLPHTCYKLRLSQSS